MHSSSCCIKILGMGSLRAQIGVCDWKLYHHVPRRELPIYFLDTCCRIASIDRLSTMCYITTDGLTDRRHRHASSQSYCVQYDWLKDHLSRLSLIRLVYNVLQLKSSEGKDDQLPVKRKLCSTADETDEKTQLTADSKLLATSYLFLKIYCQ